jgi:hypothetical protein
VTVDVLEVVDELRATTTRANRTIPTITAKTTRLDELLFFAGAEESTFLVGVTADGATDLRAGIAEVPGTGGITIVEADFLAADFLATFLAELFFATCLAGAFLADFLAADFFTADFLTTRFAADFLAADFFAEGFFAADFLAAFLTATSYSFRNN